MVRQADGSSEGPREGVHHPQIGQRGIGGVVADALKDGQIGGSGATQRGHRGLHLGHVGHAGGEHDRESQGADHLEHRQIRDVARRDLEAPDAEALQITGALRIEWGGHELDADVRAVGEQHLVIRGGELEAGQHLVLALLAPGRPLLVLGLRRAPGQQPIHGEGLELDRIGARRHRDVHERTRERGIAVVVDAGFGNHERPGIHLTHVTPTCSTCEHSQPTTEREPGDR